MVSGFFFPIWNIVNNKDEQSLYGLLCVERGLNSKELKEAFFSDNPKDQLHNPEDLHGYKKALNRIFSAIKNKERIVVFGDYDVDGVTGTTLMVDVLQQVGAQVSYRIPHRKKDGYGLKNYFLDELKEKGVSLVVTVDNGIAAVKEAAHAKDIGIDLIITDHHTVQENLPDAYVVVNPQQKECNYKCKEICGAAVSYKIALGIAKNYFSAEEYELYADSRLDLVALATVADCMPLFGENRAFVQLGLAAMEDTWNDGLRALFQVTNIVPQKLQADSLGFQIAPRINAAGRLDHAYIALQLLLGKTNHAEMLESLNIQRKNIVKEVLKSVALHSFQNELILLSSPDWHTGVIGLIAGKLTEQYCLPSIILEEQEGRFVASCRAPDGFDMFQFLSKFSEFFDHFGGHSQAAGFSISPKKFLDFEKAAKKYGKEVLSQKPLQKQLSITSELSLENVSFETLKEIDRFAPFGIGNTKPVFLLKDVQVQWGAMGKEKEFLQGTLETPQGKIRLYRFSDGDKWKELQEKGSMDIVVSLEKNTWKGVENLQLSLIDFREAIKQE